MASPSHQPSEEEDASTLQRRCDRAFKHGEKILCNLKQVSQKELRKHAFSIRNLEKLVAERPQSVTAKRLLESARCMERGIGALERHDKKSAASNLAEALRKNKDVLFTRNWDHDLITLTMASMSTLFSDAAHDKNTRAEALFVHAQLLNNFFRQKEQALKQCQLAHILLPGDPLFLVAKGHLLRSEGDNDEAFKAFEKAANLSSDNAPEMSLYYAARALQDLDSVANIEKIISLFREYVQRAEPDAWRVPEALHWLALKHAELDPSCMGKAKHYFVLAEESETRSLPFDRELNPGLIYLKETSRKLLKNYIACGNINCSAAANRPCSRCEQVCYCSQECLNADWPSHKAFCKKQRKGKDKKQASS